MSLILVEVEFSVWPFVKAAKRVCWVSERVQNRSGCEMVMHNSDIKGNIYRCRGR